MTTSIDQVADDRLRVRTESTTFAQAIADAVRDTDGCVEAVAGIRTAEFLFDLAHVDADSFRKRVLDACESVDDARAPGAGRTHDIAVRYGQESGPDLADVCELLGMPPEEFIRRHTNSTLKVAMLGFTPGFAYLDGMDPALAVPRRESPRAAVAAGSVGIAAGRTGVYALPGPGGWQIIGRTEAALFDPESDSPFLLAPGDSVRFVVADE